MVPFIVMALLDRYFALGFVLLAVAALTDGLDGFLARRLHQRTVLGEYLDPVADKLLLSTLFLVLTHLGLISWHVTTLVFSRDVGILVVSAILYTVLGIRDFRPSLYGKASTCSQIVTLVLVLLEQIFHRAWMAPLRQAALLATVVLTVVSALHYCWRMSRRLGMLGTPSPAG